MIRSDPRSSTAPPEPIAIVGMACRFPGGADTPDAYWSLLRSGRQAIVETPRERWDVDAFYDPDPAAPGKMYSRHGAYIDQRPERFDAAFFGISPHEARPMDPTHRLLLEVAWECLEDAGLPPRSLHGSATGVFAGVGSVDYLVEQIRVGTPKDLTAYHAMAPSAFASGRISHVLGLEGPAVSIDTACSSSLVATLMAVDSLRAGACSTALAGGTHLILTPTSTAVLCRVAALSLTGRSKVFDEEADGFVRGEGAGMVALRRLSDAQAAGDRILAVLRGGAWNHDGRSDSIATPRGESQERAIRATLASCGLGPNDIDYIEAHGTGTPVGDPIEVTAIGNVLASDRPADEPLLMASGKTNIGHLEAASGVAALIKVVLALQHREVPAHLGLIRPNPSIDWDRYGIEVPRETVPWPGKGRPRRASINSFGMSGTNSHLVVEEAPTTPAPQRDGRKRACLIPLSGRTDDAVREQARRYAAALRNGSEAIEDFCHTAGAGRSHDRRRGAVVGATKEEMVELLLKRASGSELASGNGGADPSVAFLYTGQGAQYAGMGRDLLDSSDVFRSVMEDCDRLLRAHLEHSLLDVVYGDAYPGLVHRTDYTQPALLSLELALTELWASWGVRPSLVMGHSVGELTAATVAGVFSTEDALALVATRGRLMRELAEEGSMAVAFAGEDVVRGVLREIPHVSIAAINGPQNTVVSGRTAALERALGALEAEGVGHERLEVSHAFHSPLMDPVLDPFLEAVSVTPRELPGIPLISNLSGDLVEGSALTDPEYWRDHVRSPVRFAASVEALQRTEADVFLELGPSPTLLGMAALNLSSTPAAMAPSLREGRPDERQMLEAAGQLYQAGQTLDWAGLAAGADVRRVAIPTYPFQRKPHWFRAGVGDLARASSTLPVRGVDTVRHPLLGTRLRSPELSGVCFQGLMEPDEPRYLGSYRVGSAHFVPLAAQLELVRAGVEEGLRWESFELADVRAGEPFGIPRGDGRICQVSFTDPEQGSSSFRVASVARSGSGTPRWVLHLSGEVRRARRIDEDGASLEELRARCGTPVEATDLYERIKSEGLRLGAFFRPIREVYLGSGEALARVELPAALAHEAADYGVHPSLLQGVFQLANALTKRADGEAPDPLTTTGISRFRVLEAAGSMVWVHARMHDGDDAGLSANITCLDEVGRTVATCEGTALRRVPLAQMGKRVVAEDEWSFGVYWHERPAAPRPFDGRGHWLVVGDGDGVGSELVRALRESGADVTHRVPPDEVERPDGSTSDWAADVLAELDAAGVGSLRGVISCLGLFEATRQSAHARLERSIEVAGSTTELVARLGRATSLDGPVLLLTCGSVSLGGEEPGKCLESSTIWGLLPIIRTEYSGMETRVLDLDPSHPMDMSVRDVLQELSQVDGESRVAHRGGRRFCARLEPFHDVGPTRETLIRPDRAYLVTGGLGWLGRAVAEWLVAGGAGLIALNARRAPDDATAAWIRALRERGARVEVVLGDVSDEAAVSRMLGGIAETGMDLGGIFHAAGILWNGPIDGLTRDRLRQLMTTKVQGTWNLHNGTLDRSLDLFVLFGSIGALVGRALQGGYAAANAYFPAFAAHRAASGLPVTCVEWGLWEGGGMASDVAERALEALTSSGMELLDPERAMSVLEDHLREQSRRVAIASLDWSRVSESVAGLSLEPFLAELVEHVERDEPEDLASALAALEELEALSTADRTARLVQVVTEKMAQVLDVAPAELPADLDVRLSGLDSLMALDLRHRLESEVGLVMPVPGPMGTLSPKHLGAVLAEQVPAAARAARTQSTESAEGWVEGEI